MKKFWTSKKFWFFILALILIGLLIYFVFFSKKKISFPQKTEKEEEELRKDKFEPASQIKSPVEGFWLKSDFSFEVLDEDLDSGLDLNSCQYKVLSYEPGGQEHSSGWQKRKCNSLSWVGVGLGKWCRFEGEKACWVFVSSKDKAGNQHQPSEEKGSIKYYHLDWTAPKVGKVSLENGEAILKVIDNFKVIGCNLYLDNKNLGSMSFLVPGCQKECTTFKALEIEFKPGESKVFGICQDAAGNYGRGEELLIKENLPPKISSCKVIPTYGNTKSNFQFFVEAKDPDEEEIFYQWDFGDGEISKEKNPIHSYKKSGQYKPGISVSDSQGAKDSCLTAWVTVISE